LNINISFLPTITVTEGISQLLSAYPYTCAVPVSLICSQLLEWKCTVM